MGELGKCDMSISGWYALACRALWRRALKEGQKLTHRVFGVVWRLFAASPQPCAGAMAVAHLLEAIAFEHLIEFNLSEPMATDKWVVASNCTATAPLQRFKDSPLAFPRNHTRRTCLDRHLCIVHPDNLSVRHASPDHVLPQTGRTFSR